jgi:hypothetical protein
MTIAAKDVDAGRGGIAAVVGANATMVEGNNADVVVGGGSG